MLDTAHTAQSIVGLVSIVRAVCASERQVHVVVGLAADKAATDIAASLAELPLASVHCVEADIAGEKVRAYSAADLAKCFVGVMKHAAVPVRSLQCCGGQSAVAEALCAVTSGGPDGKGAASHDGQTNPMVLVTGSTYVVADALQYIQPTRN